MVRCAQGEWLFLQTDWTRNWTTRKANCKTRLGYTVLYFLHSVLLLDQSLGCHQLRCHVSVGSAHCCWVVSQVLSKFPGFLDRDLCGWGQDVNPVLGAKMLSRCWTRASLNVGLKRKSEFNFCSGSLSFCWTCSGSRLVLILLGPERWWRTRKCCAKSSPSLESCDCRGSGS